MPALPLYISIPAWGRPYVELATRWTVPAVLASLDARPVDGPVTFIIHTDKAAAFRQVMPNRSIEFPPFARHAGHRSQWTAFKKAHREAIAATPDGAVVALLNADIVVSRETFQVVDEVFADAGKKVIVSVGVRTLIDGNTPPVGADAETLARWIWSHRHPITDDCIWGKGKTGHPTIIFWDDEAGNVGMGGFHLTPMFVRKDRVPVFKGTIDDDMIANYQPDELHYLRDRAAVFAELSPGSKTDKHNWRFDIDSVVAYGRRRFSAAQIRNLEQAPLTILGAPQRHPSVDNIVTGLRR